MRILTLINELLRKKHKPVVDLLVYGHAPQSKLENPLRVSVNEVLKNKLLPGLFLRYFKTCSSANICSSVGAANS